MQRVVGQVDNAKVMCGVEQSRTDKSDPTAVAGQFQAGRVDLHPSGWIDDLVLSRLACIGIVAAGYRMAVMVMASLVDLSSRKRVAI
jgi:hypothetical protein